MGPDKLLNVKGKEKIFLNTHLVKIIIRYKDYTNAVERVCQCIKKLVVRGVWCMEYFLHLALGESERGERVDGSDFLL